MIPSGPKGPTGPSGPQSTQATFSASSLLNDLKNGFNSHLGALGATGPAQAVPISKEEALRIVAQVMWDYREHLDEDSLREIWEKLQVRDVMES